GNHASAYHCATCHADLAPTVTKLGLTDAASPLNRRCKCLSQIWVEPCRSALQSSGRYSEGVRKHSIETHGVVPQCSYSAARDAIADRPNDLGRGGHIEICSGHNGGVIEPLTGRPAAAKIDHPKHGEILRPRHLRRLC